MTLNQHPSTFISHGTIILGVTVNDTPVVNTTEFACPFSSATSLTSTEDDRQLVIPRGMTLHSLTVEHTNTQAVTVMVVTVKIDGADTTITVDIPLGAAGFVQDLTNRVHINTGQEIGISFASQAGATNATIKSFTLLGDLD